jgi:hypothetical protein
LVSETVRFRPFPAADSQVQPLVDLARTAAAFIAPGFDSPEVVRDRHYEDVPYQSDDTSWRVGDARTGFRVLIHNGYMDPGAHVVNRVLVTTYGLPEGSSLEIECCRSGYDPRFLELRVTADEAALARVVASFREQFEAEAARPLTPREMESEALSIRNCLRRDDWERAEQRARYVLARHADQPDALLGLGCALVTHAGSAAGRCRTAVPTPRLRHRTSGSTGRRR